MQPVSIITPCYNESEIIVSFLRRLERVLSGLPFSFTVVVVDDCSGDGTLAQLREFSFNSKTISLHILSLERNAGHQAAICEGFRFARSLECRRFIVMDSDGQDAPEVIPLLLQCPTADIVHVVRRKRSEPALFRFSYYCYRILFRVSTGKRMNYGNFCLISRPMLERAVDAGFTHLPAFLSKQKCPVQYVLANREPRMGGKSKMSFIKLCRHALRSFGEYWNVVKLPRLLPLLLLLVACKGSPSRQTAPFHSVSDFLYVAPFSLFIYNWEFGWAFGHGYQYYITADSLKISYHYAFQKHDSVVLQKKLDHDIHLKILSEMKVDTLQDMYWNQDVMDGYQLLFIISENKKEKTLWVLNQYVPEIGEVIALVDSLVPAQYRMPYPKDMFDFSNLDTLHSLRIK